jgi:acetyltransferase
MEMIAGISRDPDFGPVVAVGAGGIYTEIVKDIALRIAPFTEATAEEMIPELKTATLLQGYRGQSPLAIGSFIKLITMLSRLAVNYPDIRELDLNPVFVLEDRVLVGDTRILIDE